MSETYEDRRARLAADRASWPERYPVVAEMIEKGFVPDAYGMPDGSGYRPPTKFHYERGGIIHPNHAGGPVFGSFLKIWSQTLESPEVLRARTVWTASPDYPMNNVGFPRVPMVTRVTLDDAVRYCEIVADHLERHYIVPQWWTTDRSAVPELLVREWRELAAVTIGKPTQEAQQLDLFSPTRDPREGNASFRLQRAIRHHTDRLPETLSIAIQDRDLSVGIDQLLYGANTARSVFAPLVPAFESVS